MLVRALLVALFTIPMLVEPSKASACKCRFADEAELAEHYAVFAGKAVEYLEREAAGDEPWRLGGRVNAAIRFEVEYSSDLPVGSTVVVVTDIWTSCSTGFRIGEHHLVTAYRQGDVLTVSECPFLDEPVLAALRRKLGIPGEFPHPHRYVRHQVKPPHCAQPATLDQAFRAADAVLWWDAKASCLIPGTNVVEHAAVARWAWKGIDEDQAFRVRVTGHADEAFVPFAFSSELLEATERDWPPANFLRREGDSFVNDGCLIPKAPSSFEAGREALLRLFPLPEDYPPRREHRPAPARPALSCSTLDDAVFTQAEAGLARHAQSVEGESSRERYHRPEAQRHAGSCAGCSTAPPGLDPLVLALVVALSLVARVITPKPPARSQPLNG